MQEFLNKKINNNPKMKHIHNKLFPFSIGYAIIELKENKGQKVIIKKLPNMICLNEDGWKACIQLRTMIAMIHQKTNRDQIMKEFYQLNS